MFHNRIPSKSSDAVQAQVKASLLSAFLVGKLIEDILFFKDLDLGIFFLSVISSVCVIHLCIIQSIDSFMSGGDVDSLC